jgi:hypothetical protein
VFRSIVIAFAALLAMGPARDRAVDKEPASEGDRGGDLNLTMSAWALPRDARKAPRAPVSEL